LKGGATADARVISFLVALLVLRYLLAIRKSAFTLNSSRGLRAAAVHTQCFMMNVIKEIALELQMSGRARERASEMKMYKQFHDFEISAKRI
jgi:hypothetical protein